MHPHSRLIAPVVLVVLGFASAARAEPGELEHARALFDEAGELERQGRWPAAQERLRAALRIRETPHLRYALGWALENGDRLIEARTEYEVALRLGQRDGIEEVSRLASTRIAEVDRKIPLLQLHVRGALAPGTHIDVDGREVIMRGDIGTVPVDPGAHTVQVARGGKSTTEAVVTMTPGVFSVVEVQGDETGVAGADDGNGRVADTRGRSPTLPWVLVASGGALAFGAIVLFVSSSGDVSERDKNTKQWCDATSCIGGNTATRPETPDAATFRREAYDAASRGNTKQVVGAILGGIGVAAVATGTYLLFADHARNGPTHAAKAGLRIDAAPLPGGGMAGASLTF